MTPALLMAARRHRPGRYLGWLLAAGACACARDPRLDAAQEALRLGRLDDAQGLLAALHSRGAERLRRALDEACERRELVRASLDALRADRAQLPLRELFRELRALREGTSDPVVHEWISAELSATIEWAAERPWPGGEPRFETPGEPFIERSQARVAGAERTIRRAAWPGGGGFRQRRQIGDEGLSESERLARSLERARGARRDEALARLAALARESAAARSSLVGVVELRWRGALQAIAASPQLADLAALAEARGALDGRRAKLLELVFDEREYFYPCTRPEVSAERIHEYFLVQREVERRIELVDELFRSTPPVVLAADLRASFEELDALRPLLFEFILPLRDLPELSAWATVQDSRRSSLQLSTFALSIEDRERIRRDELVRAWNEHRWRRADEIGIEAATPPERELVRLTNDYRVRMGRPALAWNRCLQQAARQHAGYMDQHQTLGHAQASAERVHPHMRMRLAGYAAPLAESVYAGSGAALPALRGWQGSSLHHRLLLTDRAREVACGVSGTYWAQELGADDAFEQELNAWRD